MPDGALIFDPVLSRQHRAPDDFSLPPDHPYLKNLAILWAVDPALATRLEAMDDADLYAIQPTKIGVPTLALPAAGAKPVYLHSRYDPASEAKKLVDAVIESSSAGEKQGQKAAYYVHGFGLGYHVEALFAATGPDTPVFVFEPDLRLLRTAFWHRDFSALLAGRRLHLITSDDKSDLVIRLTPHLAVLSLGVGTLDHSPSLTVQPDHHALIKRQLDEFAAYGRTTINTVVLNSTKTAENIARNLAWYAAAPCLSRLKNRFKGKPAIIVSAGPSLRKNKHLLPAVADKAVIIAVQTTFQPLLEMGVEPHFVTSLDYHDISARFFENLPSGTRRTELVAEPKTTDRVLSLFEGNVTLLNSDYANALLRELPAKRDGLPAGATVAHLSFYLAEYLGCDPIIFLGQDLGFSDGLFYSPGTSYEDVWRPEMGRFCTVEMKQWEQIVRERFLLRRIPDYQGRPMYTEERLFTYLQQFERDFLRSDRTIIDATEGGAAGNKGSTSMPFADAIERHCTEPFTIDLSDHPGSAAGRSAACVASLEKRREEAGRIETISRQTLPLLEEVHDHLDDQSRVNRAIARLDALRQQMNAVGPAYDLVTELNQRSQLDRFAADRRIGMATLDPKEKQRRQVTRDIANVRAVMDAARRFQELMTEAIGRLS